jgi:hypothetical protein
MGHGMGMAPMSSVERAVSQHAHAPAGAARVGAGTAGFFYVLLWALAGVHVNVCRVTVGRYLFVDLYRILYPPVRLLTPSKTERTTHRSYYCL